MQAVLPELTVEQATLAAQLATVAVSAVLFPTAIPEPTPAPIYAALLSCATRFGMAILQGSSLPVLSESLGSYSYRLAAPASLAAVFGLTEEELTLLGPWTNAGAYDVRTPSAVYPWPADWWQTDRDNVLKAAEEEA